MVGVSKIVAWVKPTPSPEQAAVLASTLGALNDHAAWVAKAAHEQGNTNHQISKRIVAEAERTGRGISPEDLTRIRIRVRQRRPQRVTLHTWSFHHLGQFIVCKARRTGVPVVFVDAAYTSQTCAGCGHVDHRNRVDQATFLCRGCGVVAHADRNASADIAARGRVVRNAGRKSHVPPD
ncbi:zinc ribbon domain-containing protein, partial [Nocardiopsis dassonvillei]